MWGGVFSLQIERYSLLFRVGELREKFIFERIPRIQTLKYQISKRNYKHLKYMLSTSEH